MSVHLIVLRYGNSRCEEALGLILSCQTYNIYVSRYVGNALFETIKRETHSTGLHGGRVDKYTDPILNH